MSEKFHYEFDAEQQVLIRCSCEESPKIIRKSSLVWRDLGPKDESYARAIHLGQGCWEKLNAITEEEAQSILTQWGYRSKSNSRYGGRSCLMKKADAASTRITSFKLDWHSCGLCCADDVVHECITISRNRCKVLFSQLNGYGDVVCTESIKIPFPMVEEFFCFLERAEGQWKADYSVEVCDGSTWEVLIRYGTHKTRKICGTIEYPPCGSEIEKFITTFVEQAESLAAPIMFGCAESD